MELDYQGIDPYGTFCIYNLKDRINQIVYRITLGDTNKIEEFQKTVYKRLFKNEDYKEDIDVLIMITNIHLNLLKNFLDLIRKEGILYDYIQKEYEDSIIPYLLNCLKDKNLCFTEKSFFIYNKNEDIQMQLLDEDQLNKHFKGFLSSTTITDKEEKMNYFSNKIADFLNNSKKGKKYWSYIEQYFNEQDIKRFCLMCQGYFRHTPKESNKEQYYDNNQILTNYSKEWTSYKNNLEKKLQIMNNIFSIYLTILIILKNANLLDDFLKNI